jgi:hypothetical protein
MLQTQQLREKFDIHAKQELSSENIDLWKTIEQFKTISDSHLRRNCAQSIFENFVDIKSDTCVNITE